MVMAVVAEWLTFAVYVGVAAIFLTYLRTRHVKVLRKVFVLLCCVFFLCGCTHLIGSLMYWWPAYRFDVSLRLLSGFVGVAALTTIWWLLPKVMRMPRAGKEHELYEEVLRLRERLNVKTHKQAHLILEEVINDLKLQGN